MERGRSPKRYRYGVTMVELLITIGFLIIISGFMVPGFLGRRNQNALKITAQEIVTMLREAQARSMNQASSTTWGVHFENSTNVLPFFSLYSGAYATATRSSYYPLQTGVSYVTSSLAQGAVREISFNQFTGTAVASNSVKINLTNLPAQSSTIAVASSGVISY